MYMYGINVNPVQTEVRIQLNFSSNRATAEGDACIWRCRLSIIHTIKKCSYIICT